MPSDTMASEQRHETAIDLGVPDRAPVAPSIHYFAARYAKVTTYELWSNPERYSFAIEKCFPELGRWEIYFPIFRAKEVIGEHRCLFGDVPSTMRAFGNQQDVLDYCKKLIDVVGRNGGFILAAGCEIPPNAGPENVKAMIDAAARSGY